MEIVSHKVKTREIPDNPNFHQNNYYYCKHNVKNMFWATCKNMWNYCGEMGVGKKVQKQIVEIMCVCFCFCAC